MTVPRRAQGVGTADLAMCTCGMRRSIADRVSFVRATMPTSRTNAARPSTLGPISGTMNPPLPSPAKIRPGVARAWADRAAVEDPVQTTPTEW